MQHKLQTIAVLAFVVLPAPAYADPVTLARGATVSFDYNSAVFGETVALTVTV